MIRRNMGRLDRTIRFVAGVTLAPIGLFSLSGWQGTVVGVFVVAVSALLLVTSLTGFCPGYVPFGISTTGSDRRSTERLAA